MIREHALPPLHSAKIRPLGGTHRFFSRLLARQLEGLSHGRITVFNHDGAQTFGSSDAADALHASVIIHDPDFYVLAATRGSLGVAEAYMEGMWDSDDLTTLIRVMARNEAAVEGLNAGLARLMRPLLRGFALAHRNTRRQSRANIAAHYDLGNGLFEQFLDDSMTYSSAVFDHPGATLEQAQQAKYEGICRKLAIGRDDHVLEIGTGWGGFAVYAAARYKCRVTTTTISAEQFAVAAQRVREAGLEDQVELLSCDYRDLTGTYDKLVSIEMIEAVGHEYMEDFFRTCGRRLRHDGACLLQAIVQPDQAFEASKTSVDFIKRYIFPGGSLPSVWSMCDAARNTTDFRLVHLDDITVHYATTLRHWRRRMDDRLETIKSLGYSDRFLRMWQFYFCYCEAGFRERSIHTVQVLFERQHVRPTERGRIESACAAEIG